MRGVGDGMAYAESHKPMRNPGALDPVQQLQMNKAQEELNDYYFSQGKRTKEYKDINGNTIHYRYDPLKQGYIGTVYDKGYDFKKPASTQRSKYRNFTGIPTEDGMKWEGLNGANSVTTTPNSTSGKKGGKKNPTNADKKDENKWTTTVEEQGYTSIDPSKDYSKQKVQVNNPPTLSLQEYPTEVQSAIRSRYSKTNEWNKLTDPQKAQALQDMGIKTITLGTEVKYVKRKQNTPSTPTQKVGRGA